MNQSTPLSLFPACRLPRRSFVLGLGLGAAAYGLGAQLTQAGLIDERRRARALGAEVEIQVRHRSRSTALAALDAAFRELDQVEDVLSLYRPDSQLCQLNRYGTLERPHPYLIEVLQSAQDLAEQTHGKFDVTIQPLWQLHDQSASAGRTPTTKEREWARRLVNWRQLEVTDHEIRFRQPQMKATLNGIAQGFAADRVRAVLQQHGIEHALINAGELAALGLNRWRQPWCVGVQHPRQPDAWAGLVRLDGRCLATSGDYASCWGGDRTRHHLLDPETGVSACEFASVSILAPSAMLADGLSTAVFVLGVEPGIRLIQATADADLFAVLADGSTICTTGFPLQDEVSA